MVFIAVLVWQVSTLKLVPMSKLCSGAFPTDSTYGFFVFDNAANKPMGALIDAPGNVGVPVCMTLSGLLQMCY